jgi:3',5'-cyclic-AMP phosphodiesterase
MHTSDLSTWYPTVAWYRNLTSHSNATIKLVTRYVKRMKKLFALLVFIVAGCENFEYSPNQVFDNDTPKNLNEINLARIASSVSSDDTVTIALVGDSQRFYDEVDDFVDKVNQMPSVDFVFLAGDITDFGLLSEYEWIHNSFSRLHAPYLGVIGNHDVQANGEEVFARMYGPLDYSFVYDSIKFIVHNTNGREYIDKPVPDIDWLTNQIKSENSGAVKYFVAVSHVPPTDADFNQTLVQPYIDLFASTQGFLVSLHAHVHKHTDAYPFNNGTRYISAFAFDDRTFLLLKFYRGTLTKHKINY